MGTLAAAGRRFGFTVEGVPLLRRRRATDLVLHLRPLLRRCGDVVAAARALGREHRVEGVVVRGDQRGRELGYPTANLEPLPLSAMPADGIYAGRLVRGGEPLPAAISIGTNPTFAGTERRVEAFVLDFDGDLYGEQVGLDFVGRLRDTVRFDGVEALMAQMARDVAAARDLLGVLTGGSAAARW